MYFDLALHLCKRGKESLRALEKDSLEIKKTESGQEYVQMKYNEDTKNHKVMKVVTINMMVIDI